MGQGTEDGGTKVPVTRFPADDPYGDWKLAVHLAAAARRADPDSASDLGVRRIESTSDD
jgi:hypothetical protein